MRLSKEYKNSCLKSGAAPLNGAKPASNDEVFVWGSNSSHQLAEGSTDKILSAKLSASFGGAQQVEIYGLSIVQCFKTILINKCSINIPAKPEYP